MEGCGKKGRKGQGSGEVKELELERNQALNSKGVVSSHQSRIPRTKWFFWGGLKKRKSEGGLRKRRVIRNNREVPVSGRNCSFSIRGVREVPGKAVEKRVQGNKRGRKGICKGTTQPGQLPTAVCSRKNKKKDFGVERPSRDGKSWGGFNPDHLPFFYN